MLRRPITIRLNLEITVTTSAEAQAVVDAINALPGRFAAAEQTQIDAAKKELQDQLDAANAALATEKQDHADDLAAVRSAVTSVSPAPS